ncbi:MAG: hypothetical protein IPK00_08610 [Deltaproteobacteria bacterium]|nr:hypothetical protein [Deltaproteobacteria bacterium]
MIRIALVVPILVAIAQPAAAVTYDTADSYSIQAWIDVEVTDGVDYWIDATLSAPELATSIDLLLEETDSYGIHPLVRRFAGHLHLSAAPSIWAGTTGSVTGTRYGGVDTSALFMSATNTLNGGPLAQQFLSGETVFTETTGPYGASGTFLLDGEPIPWSTASDGIRYGGFFGHADALDWTGPSVHWIFSVERNGLRYSGLLRTSGAVRVSTPVPEASTALLVGLGLTALAGRRDRRRLRRLDRRN